VNKFRKIKKVNKNLRAYSLLEMLISLAIVAIVMMMMTNTLVITIEISRKSFARSIVREEQNNLLTKIEKDIRNARYVSGCTGENDQARCEVGLDKPYIWTTCDRDGGFYVCKKDSSESVVIEGFSEDIKVDYFSFQEGLADAEGKKSILVTLAVSHSDPSYEVTNQVRQIIISTRNYEI